MALTLKDESGQSSAPRGTARVRKGLVCAQVMISAVLLIPTGLFLKSLVNLMHVDLGMKTENVIGFSRFAGAERLQAGADAMRCSNGSEAEMAAIPGVRGVAAALVPLIAGSNWGNNVRIEGAKAAINSDSNSRMNEVGPGILRQDGDSADRRPRVHGGGQPGGTEGRDRQPAVREGVSGRPKPDRAQIMAAGRQRSIRRSSAW